MKPARLELDHLRKTPRPARISWVLLAIALAFAADVGSPYVKTRAEIEARTAKLARLSGARPAQEASASAPAGALSKEEFGAAQDTILRLSMPWDNVVRALESARSDEVAPLSIGPDAGSRALSITGDPRSNAPAPTYV